MLGTYLFPLVFFGTPMPNEPTAVTEEIRQLEVGSHLVHVTRGGGLFVDHPPGFGRGTIAVQLDFHKAVATALNQLICEFTLAARIVTEPTSNVYLGSADNQNGHINIMGAAGGRESYWERSMGPACLLYSHIWSTFWRSRSESALDQVSDLSMTTKLLSVSDTAPTFTAAAYSLYSRRQMAEAIVDAWIVMEQIINDLWERHRASLQSARRNRLHDNRTYPASVRTEILESVGLIDSTQAGHFHQARGHRNQVAHRAFVGPEAAHESMVALKSALEFVCGQEVATPVAAEFV